MTWIAAIFCFFYSLDKLYQWFHSERKHQISIKYTERQFKLDEKSNKPLERMSQTLERAVKK